MVGGCRNVIRERLNKCSVKGALQEYENARGGDVLVKYRAGGEDRINMQAPPGAPRVPSGGI